MKKLNFLAIAFCLASFSPTYGDPAEKTIWQETEERAALDRRPVADHITEVTQERAATYNLHLHLSKSLSGRLYDLSGRLYDLSGSLSDWWPSFSTTSRFRPYYNGYTVSNASCLASLEPNFKDQPAIFNILAKTIKNLVKHGGSLSEHAEKVAGKRSNPTGKQSIFENFKRISEHSEHSFQVTESIWIKHGIIHYLQTQEDGTEVTKQLSNKPLEWDERIPLQKKNSA